MEVSSNSDPAPILINACLQGVCSPVANLNVNPKGQEAKVRVVQQGWFLATEWELTLPTVLAWQVASLTHCEEVSRLRLLNKCGDPV